jgi:3-hydroxyisobutyrate dehydrogenase-like beta-hydroxyacid dehydrogenase
MGRGVVHNLLRNNHEVTVHVRSEASQAQALVSSGAMLSPSLDECLTGKQVVFLCLPSMEAWDEVLEAALVGVTPGTLLIDLTSAHPARTRSIQAHLATRGCGFVDAPMLKGPAAAMAGEIQLLVGGDDGDVAKALPILREISEAQYRTGGPGSGHALKLINNAVTLTNSAIIYESFAVAALLGVDLGLAHKAMDNSAASSKRLNAIAPVLISGRHAPSFDISTALKDLELYCDMVKEAGGLSFAAVGARSLYRLGNSYGLGATPVTYLAELLFDLMSGKVDTPGQTPSIHLNTTKGETNAD